MSVTIPFYFEAKQISTAAVTPQTPGAGGVLTGASLSDMIALGIFDHFTCTPTRNPFEYSPANSVMENYQPGKNGFTASIGQIDQAGKSSLLTDIYAVYTYLRVAGQATNPLDGTLGKYFVLIGMIGDLSTGFVEGKNATTLELRPCGIPIQWSTTPTI